MSSRDSSPGSSGPADAALEAEIECGASLRRFAFECIAFALEHARVPRVDPLAAPPQWRLPGACFVTLRIGGALRGCTGGFDASQPIVCAVASCAVRTAFEDPRFPALTAAELPGLDVEISLVAPPRPLPVESREELLRRIAPGVDGLILIEGERRATFLPAVWDSLPSPPDFVDALLQKAGLPSDYWSGSLRFERYTTTTAD